MEGKPEGKISLGSSRHCWESNIKISFVEIGWEGMDWIQLFQDKAISGSCEHDCEPLGSVEVRVFTDYLGNY
jgi:hypothetical protein